MASVWDDMTVAELRKYAREHGITLSAGINKQGILDRIAEHEQSQAPEQLTVETVENPVETPAETQPKPAVRRASIISDDDDESREIGYGMGTYTRPQTERPRYSSDPVRTPAAPAARSTSDVLSTISSKAPAFHIDSGTKAWHNPRSFQPNNYHAPASPATASHTPYGQRAADPARTAAPVSRPHASRTAAPGPAEPVQPAPTPSGPCRLTLTAQEAGM